MHKENAESSDAPWSGRRCGRRRSGGAPPYGPEQERLIAAWFAGRIPEGWFEGPVRIEVDQDELQVVGVLPSPQLPEGASEEETRVAEQAKPALAAEESTKQAKALSKTQAALQDRVEAVVFIDFSQACSPFISLSFYQFLTWR